MGRRRGWGSRRSARADSSLIVIGFVAVAIAALWVYIVAIGVIAIVVGLVRLVFTQSRKPAALTPTTTATATFEPPMATDYTAVADVATEATQDPVATQQAVLRVFGAWARGLPKAPRDPSPLVRKMDSSRRLIVRRDTFAEGRRIVWRFAPYQGRAKVSGPPVDIDAFDAWNAPSDLLQQSKYVCSCETCSGAGKIGCALCGADGKVTCAECNGAGKVVGYTTNNQRRVLNCKGCRGNGQVACLACTRGKIECPACHGCKKLERWLEVQVWNSQDVQVEPDDYQRVFRWSRDGERASIQEMETDAFVTGSASADRPLTVADTPPAIPAEDRDRILAAVRPQLQPGERITKQRLLVLEVPAIGVTYGLGDDEQTIELMGRRLLAPKPSVDQVFRRRSRLLNWMVLALAAMPLLVAAVYLQRGEYFRSPEVGGVVGSIAAAAILVYGVIWHATLGRRAIKWLGAAPVPLVAAAIFAFLAEPSLDDAKTSLAKGDLDAALVELEALGGPDDPDLAPTYAALRLRQLEKASTSEEASRLLSLIPEGPLRDAGMAQLDTLLLAEVRAAYEKGDEETATARLADGSDALRANPEIVQLRAAADLLAGRLCLGNKDWTCAWERAASVTKLGVADGAALRDQTTALLRQSADALIATADKTKDLETRVSTLTTAQDQLALLETWTSPESTTPSKELARLRERLAKDTAALTKRREAEEKKRAAAEAKRLKAEAKAAEKQRKREEAAERRAARSYGALLCNDGTTSPTCTCGGSHRGCCSRHGGVAGCE